MRFTILVALVRDTAKPYSDALLWDTGLAHPELEGHIWAWKATCESARELTTNLYKDYWARVPPEDQEFQPHPFVFLRSEPFQEDEVLDEDGIIDANYGTFRRIVP